jgi:hypothetical protein
MKGDPGAAGVSPDRQRRAAWCVATGGALVMSATILYGFIAGEGWSEVARLWAFAWFRVSIVDIYVGLAVIALWIWSRERPLAACTWSFMLLTLGHLATCLYLLRVLLRGDRPII